MSVLHSWLLKVQSELVLITSNGFPWSVANSSYLQTWMGGWWYYGCFAVFDRKKMLWYMKDNIIIVHFVGLNYFVCQCIQAKLLPVLTHYQSNRRLSEVHSTWVELSLKYLVLTVWHLAAWIHTVLYIVYPYIMAVVNLSLFVIKANVYSCPSVLLLIGTIQKTQWQLC